MNSIRFENVYKNYGPVKVISDLNLEIPSGQRLVLLGPSGCGKTTILRMIAGLESITKGNLYMNGGLANHVEPADRNVAMVFQNYALYPHMTVEKNVCFGLDIAKISKAEQEKRMADAFEMLGLTEYAKRKPKELSGGQRQRVALARALVKNSPYLLLDEPLSNLDAKLRTHARAELVKIHEVYNPTFVYVTHDQVEAMTIGQQIALLHKGVIQQLAEPETIYNRPKNVFVATFIGAPSMNVINASIEDGNLVLGSEQRVPMPEFWLKVTGNNRPIKVGVRPEDVVIAEGAGDIKGRLVYKEYHGNRKCMTISIPGLEESIQAATESQFNTDSAELGINIDWTKMHFFDSETEENVGYYN